MKNPFLGAHGHIAIATLNINRAIAYLKGRGVGTKPETAKEKDGKLVAVYLDREISGFALHLVQR
jgi:2-dehydro-3-deoxyphosphogluconate aldolase/(4S)-4-hydroxy-2-oxoglutarate aldolase